MILLAAKTTWLNVWLTPLWMIGAGALVALVALGLGWAVVFIVSRTAAKAVPDAVMGGPLQPIFFVTLAVATFGILTWFLAVDREEIVASMLRLPSVGVSSATVSIPAVPDDAVDPPLTRIPITFRADELRSLKVESNADLLLSLPPDNDGTIPLGWQVAGQTPFEAVRGIDKSLSMLQQGKVEFVAQNVGDEDATVTVTVQTAPKHPQASTIVITAVSIVLVFALYLVLYWLFPKASAIALATAKSEMTQPLFMLLIVLGLFLLLVFLFVPYHTFGEDIKVLKDSGLTLIMVFAIFQTVWAASNSVAEEIEGKTAVTVLSKPISRRQFILGKFMGISWATAVMFIILGLWLLVIVSYKPIYDSRESAATEPTWQACHIEVVRTVPGLVLAFLETIVFAAIGVAVSTRLPLLANLVICFTIYAFGHLTPQLVQAGEGQFVNVRFMAQFIATILPVLDHFNIQAAVASGIDVPLRYLGIAAVYCGLYAAVALLLALALFEDRDVA